MPNLYAANTSFHPAMMPPGEMRLNWLLFENRVNAEQGREFRVPAHEIERAMMHRPMSPRSAYQWLGLLLGVAPPAAIFARVFHYGLGDTGFGYEWGVGLFLLCLMTNVVCGLLGFFMGGVFADQILSAVRDSYSKMIVLLVVIGIGWGMTTGGLGGLCFFGVGAFFGMLFATPIAIAAFLVSGLVYRWLERGGQIEARHFWPLAIGIVSVITTWIASA